MLPAQVSVPKPKDEPPEHAYAAFQLPPKQKILLASQPSQL